MYDSNIREAFHSNVLKQEHIHDEILVLNELGLKNGQYRADIAVLNGKLEGFEIKSEYDTLDRLPDQVTAYNSVFEKVSIITCDKYFTKCQEIIPDWWGIYIASNSSDGAINFKRKRVGKKNPQPENYAIAQLLWRDEAYNLAIQYIKEPITSKCRRHEIYEHLAINLSTKILSKLVIETLKQRKHWREDH